MFSKLVIFTSILLASGVLAVPSSSRLETRLARHSENSRSNSINRIDARDGAYYTTNWASAVLAETAGTFNNITGTFTAPTLKGTSNGSVSVWVGIDGANTCENSGTLQSGVDFNVSGGKAWYKWSPGETGYFDGITIRAGDKIKTTVSASSWTSGKAVVENLTTGRRVTKELSSSSHSLCGRDADWSVEDLGDESGNLAPFPNFGTVRFTNASASGPGGKSSLLDGAIIVDAKQYSDVLVSVSASGDTVTISHV